MFELRDYQREALEAIEQATDQRVVVELPTGSGKTVIFSHLVHRYLTAVNTNRPFQQVLILMHRDELIQQTVAKLRAVLGEVWHRDIGVVKAERNDLDKMIIVASVQTLAKASRLGQLPECGLVVIDEAHHAAAASYVAVLRAMHAFHDGSGVKAVGFTATLMRGDGQPLGDVWQKIVYRRSILSMIEAGHLVDVRGRTIPVEGLDLNKVKTSHGDLQATDLADEMEAAMVPTAVAKAYGEYASDRSGVLFAPTVETAYSFADALNEHGITAATVTGETPIDDRQQMYSDHAHGLTQVLTNCMVLTEGWDQPAASCCVVARPTRSNGLYIQMVGRVLRPFLAGGKRDALVLDVVGVTAHNSLATLGSLRGKPVKDGQSLIEAELEELDEMIGDGATREKRQIIEHTMIEAKLFEQRPAVWLKTVHGVWFIPTMAGFVFLWEYRGADGDGYVVGTMNKAGHAEKQSDPLPIEMAMAVGEDAAGEDMSSMRGRAWRRNGQPSDKQINLLRSMGIDPTGMNRSRASDAISVAFANRSLARFAPRH